MYCVPSPSGAILARIVLTIMLEAVRAGREYLMKDL